MSILSEIHKTIPLPDGEDRQSVLEKLVRKAVIAPDAVWNGLSIETQKWINASVDQIKVGNEITDPEDAEPTPQHHSNAEYSIRPTIR